MPVTSQSWTKRNRLYIANKVILKVLYVSWPVTTLPLTHPVFWLWSKEWGHGGRATVGFKACGRSQCSCIDICTNSSWTVGLTCTAATAVLIDSICVLERENSHRNRLCKFNAPRRKNEPGKLSKPNTCCNCRVKPPYKASTKQVPGPFRSWLSIVANLDRVWMS